MKIKNKTRRTIKLRTIGKKFISVLPGENEVPVSLKDEKQLARLTALRDAGFVDFLFPSSKSKKEGKEDVRTDKKTIAGVGKNRIANSGPGSLPGQKKDKGK
jgi:hypothetical protein